MIKVTAVTEGTREMEIADGDLRRDEEDDYRVLLDTANLEMWRQC